MDFKCINSTPYKSTVYKLVFRCPQCGNKGTWDNFDSNDISISGPSYSFLLGIRKCPNPDCWRPLFFYINYKNKVIKTFPFSRIDFDVSDIPEPVKKAFSEALDCHANGCYMASAIMVRKTLEEICHEREATGDNLFLRIESLRDKVIIPQDFFDGLHDLRYLGNDAAHIESIKFSNVGEDELEAGIEFTKDFLKAIYQYKRSREKLAALKTPPSDP